jgi:hypothetical protein
MNRNFFVILALFVAASLLLIRCDDSPTDAEIGINLSDGSFIMTYTGDEQRDNNVNISPLFGFKYSANPIPRAYALIESISDDCKFVSITFDEYKKITTKQALKRAFDSSEDYINWFWVSLLKYDLRPYYFMSKYGDTYFLIKMEVLNVEEGNYKIEVFYGV